MKDQVVLVVDEDPVNLKVIAENFRDEKGITLSFARSGEQALNCIDVEKPDLVLLDIDLPGISGYDVCTEIKSNQVYRDIPVIFFTGKGLPEDIHKGFKVGAVDYIKKPFNSFELKSRVKSQLEIKKLQSKLQDKVYLQSIEIKKLSKEIENTQVDMIYTLGAVIESRSGAVGLHVRRVAEISYFLAVKYGLPENEALILKAASPMHDVGKIGIPDHILMKPDILTEAEFEIMKTHSAIGQRIMGVSDRRIFRAASIIAAQHHENWDGSGYPKGLKGEHIHIYGRISAVADVFDALTHKRVYKEAWTLEEARENIVSERGKKFDPALIDIFEENFIEIASMCDYDNMSVGITPKVN